MESDTPQDSAATSLTNPDTYSQRRGTYKTEPGDGIAASAGR